MPKVVVKQGESVNSLAFEHGFARATVWDMSENADLRGMRGDGGVLLPGDELHVPEQEIKKEDRGTEAKHSFKLPDIPFRIAVTLRRPDQTAIDGVEWKAEMDGAVTAEGTTTSDGRIEAPVPPRTKHGVLVLDGRRIPIRLRDLDPANSPSGIRQRLKNLGYVPGTGTGPLDKDDRAALQRFQADHDLSVTGEPDSDTIKELRTFHEAVELDGKPNEREDASESGEPAVRGDDDGEQSEAPDTEPDDELADIDEEDAEFSRGSEAESRDDPEREMTVRCLQSMLDSLQFKPGPIDGIVGPKTRRATRRFQSANAAEYGLHASGEADGPTRAALRKELEHG